MYKFQVHKSLRSTARRCYAIVVVVATDGLEDKSCSASDDDERRRREVERGVGVADGGNDYPGCDVPQWQPLPGFGVVKERKIQERNCVCFHNHLRVWDALRESDHNFFAAYVS